MSHDYTKTHETIGKCRVCEGALVRELHYTTRPPSKALKPEERSPYNTTIGRGLLHCQECGIIYHFAQKEPHV